MSRLSGVILRLTYAATWPRCKRIFKENQGLLQTDAAAKWLADAAAMEATEGDGPGGFAQCRDLALACRARGVDAGFASFEGRPRKFAELGEEATELLGQQMAASRAIKEILGAGSMAQREDAFQDQLPVLLTDIGDEVLADWMDSAVEKKDEDLRKLLQVVQLRVQRSRMSEQKGTEP